jgi:predicted nucleic acid-binding protein
MLERARGLHLQQRWAFWDATLVSACIESGVTRLYSEDLPGRAKIQSLEIVSPFA